MLGLTPPEFAHLPLICNNDGLRLSKRDKGLDMEHLRQTHTPQEIIGQLAYTAGIIARPTPISAKNLRVYLTGQIYPQANELFVNNIAEFYPSLNNMPDKLTLDIRAFHELTFILNVNRGNLITLPIIFI